MTFAVCAVLEGDTFGWDAKQGWTRCEGRDIPTETDKALMCASRYNLRDARAILRDQGRLYPGSSAFLVPISEG